MVALYQYLMCKRSMRSAQFYELPEQVEVIKMTLVIHGACLAMHKQEQYADQYSG
ncbi:hypothetical protein VIBNISOn1_600043 [Vibrio nigripulchritudo SOn1]|uniref:Transposase n=1 Tax=Vibrio nigripulchritudo SOn1 TaxID=1238450 RepID=A0AAV2VVL8_9VIBR|nr:hypothetical protein VIBNISOn1_600043 [Vibrio nigripulchritudo SOn1]